MNGIVESEWGKMVFSTGSFLPSLPSLGHRFFRWTVRAIPCRCHHLFWPHIQTKDGSMVNKEVTDAIQLPFYRGNRRWLARILVFHGSSQYPSCQIGNGRYQWSLWRDSLELFKVSRINWIRTECISTLQMLEQKTDRKPFFTPMKRRNSPLRLLSRLQKPKKAILHELQELNSYPRLFE